MVSTPTHTRIRPFNTKDTYPEQNLDNDLCQAVVAKVRVSMINEARAALRLPRNARFPAFDEDPEVQALRSLNDARQPASP